MYVFEISIENKTDCKPDELANEFEGLVSILYKNGQIWKECVLIQEKNAIRAHVQAYEKASLQKKFCNIYFEQYRKKLEELSGSKLMIRPHGKTTLHCEPCHCREHDRFILQTSFSHNCSPITCGSCGGAVPLYRLPYLGDEKEHYSILTWVSNYKACDHLNMNCGFGERWATKQMSDPNSGLSKDGRELCKEIEEKTGVPTYCYLYNYRNVTREQDEQRTCPVCGKPWFQNEDAFWAEQFRCAPCRLVSNLTFKT